MPYSDRQSTNFDMFNEPKSRCLWVKSGSINKAVQRVYIKSNGVLKHVRRIITKSSLTSASGSAGSEGALTDPLKTVYPQRTMHLVLNNGISTFQKDYNEGGVQYMALSFGLSCQQEAQSATTNPSPAAGGGGYVGFNSGANGPYGRGDRIYFPIGWTGKISYWVSGIARSVIMSAPASQGSEIGTGTMQMGWNALFSGGASVVYVHDGSSQNLGGNYYSPDNTNAAQRMPLLSPSQAHANVPNYSWWEFDRGSDGFSMFQLLANTSFNFTTIASTMGWTRNASWGAPTGIPTNTVLGTQLTRSHSESQAASYPVRYGLLNYGTPATETAHLSNIVSDSTHLVPNYTDEGDEGYNFPNHYYYPPLTSPWIGMMIRWDGSYGDGSRIRINPAWGTTNDGPSWNPIQQNRWVDAPGVALHMAVTTLGDIQPVLYTATQARTDLVNDQLNLFPRRVGAAATINSPASDVPY